MTRIKAVDPAQTTGYVKEVLDAQARTWGAPLLNHLVYARDPALFRALRAMWTALGSLKHLEVALVAQVNRRIALINHCAF